MRKLRTTTLFSRHFKMKCLMIFAGFLTLVSYQNCSFPSPISTSNEVIVAKGNGGGYEGKLETYYRYVTDYKCGQQASPLQKAEILDGTGTLFDFSDGQCQNPGVPVSSSQLQLSPFQNEFISVNDILFKKYDQQPTGIPDNLAELLCRDNFESPSFEIVAHYDRAKNQALTRIYFKDQMINDFSVSRLLSISKVQYVADELSLSVNFEKPQTSGTQRFRGSITHSKIPQLQQNELTCIIGGSLDTSQIAVAPLFSGIALEPLILANGDVMLTGRNPGDSRDRLFKLRSDGQFEDILLKKFGLNAYLENKYLVPSKDRLVLTIRQTESAQPISYLYNPFSENFYQITQLPSAEFNELIDPNFNFIGNRHLIFSVTDRNNFFRKVLKHYDEDKQQLVVIVESRQLRLFVQQMPLHQKILINTLDTNSGQVPNWIYDLASKSKTQIAQNLPTDCHWWEDSAVVLDGEKAFARQAICGKDQLSGELRLLKVSTIDGSITTLGVNRQITWSSPNSDWVILGDKFRYVQPTPQTPDSVTSAMPRNPSLTHVNTGKSWAIPFHPHFGYFNGQDFRTFNVDLTKFLNEYKAIKIVHHQGHFYGFGGLTTQPTLFAINPVDGKVSKVCESASGVKVFLDQLENKNVYLMTYDYNLSVFRFYRVQSPEQCERINEFPGSYLGFSNLVTTQNGFALALSEDSQPGAAKEAIYVPGDGRPPLRLKNGFKTLHSISISADRKSVFFEGTSKDSNERTIHYLKIR